MVASTTPASADESDERSKSTSDKEWTVNGLPAPFYTPETKFGLGVVGVVTRRPPGSSAEDRPQSLTAYGAYTQLGQTAVQVEPDLYLEGNEWEIRMPLSYLYFPLEYYGIGNDTPESAKENYTARSLQWQAWVMRKVWSSFRVGAVVDLARSDIIETEPGRALDQGGVVGSEGGLRYGMAPVVDWDSRNHAFYPTRGGWYRFFAAFYRRWMGSDYDFQYFALDLRQFVGVSSHVVLAFRVHGEVTGGEVPFNDLVSPKIRGILGGRFRDRASVTGQAELRFPLVWRFSGAVFTGVGDVGEDIGSISFDPLKWGVGAGARFALAPEEKLNLRLDVGYSPWGTLPYFMLQEAF